jgi:hypothetical protein
MININNEDISKIKGLVKQVAFIIRKKYWSGFLQFWAVVVFFICLNFYWEYILNKRNKAIKINMGLVEGVVVAWSPPAKAGANTQHVEYLVSSKKYKTLFNDSRKDLVEKNVLIAYFKDDPEINEVLSHIAACNFFGVDYKKYPNLYIRSNEKVGLLTYVLLLCVFGSVIYIIGKNIYVQLRADLEELNRDGGV